MNGGLRGSSLRSNHLGATEDVDPMSSLANLADVMLVFACGLMMALVSFWNIDINVTELEDDQMQAIEEPGDLPDELVSGGSAYVEKGTVYQDPTTGQYYILSDDANLGDGSGDAGDTSASGDTSDSGGTSGSAGSSGESSGGTNRVSSGATVPDRSTGAD